MTLCLCVCVCMCQVQQDGCALLTHILNFLYLLFTDRGLSSIHATLHMAARMRIIRQLTIQFQFNSHSVFRDAITKQTPYAN